MIGIGPSSSHTVGPMRAARQFTERIIDLKLTDRVTRLRCDFYGSLAATGKGHGTDHAVMLGFTGADPESIDVDDCPRRIEEIKATGRLPLPWVGTIGFNARHDLDFKRIKPLPLHPNGMHFTASDDSGENLLGNVFYSLGGGFIASEEQMKQNTPCGLVNRNTRKPPAADSQ